MRRPLLSRLSSGSRGMGSLFVMILIGQIKDKEKVSASKKDEGRIRKILLVDSVAIALRTL